jgi:hypothetical protein
MAGKNTTHKPVLTCAASCELALKSAGERTQGAGAGNRPRERSLLTSGAVERPFLGLKGGNLDAGPPAGEVLSGNLGALCARKALKALRGPCGPTSSI